jgi:hypothetical protein
MRRPYPIPAILVLVLLSACAVDDPGPDIDGGIGSDDASVPDSFVLGPDAWTPPSCPSYATDVQPLYARHCSSCHTSGRDAHFGSSIAVARQSNSACGTSMATCTIQLGSPGGAMAYRDPLGGFNPGEVQTIQAWIGCGMPN